MATSERSLEELRSQVVHTLETSGVLAQIRAQLRANVYKAIDNEEEPYAVTGQGPGGRLLKTPVGRLMAEIVAEFFEFYDFRHSLTVFLPESNLPRERRSRADVAYDAGLSRVRSDASLLEQLMDQAMSSGYRKGAEGYHSSACSTTASSPPPPQQAAGAAFGGTSHQAPSSGPSTRPSTVDGGTALALAGKAPGPVPERAPPPADREGDAIGGQLQPGAGMGSFTPAPRKDPSGIGLGGVGGELERPRSAHAPGALPAMGSGNRAGGGVGVATVPEEPLEESASLSGSSARDRRKHLGKLPSLGSSAGGSGKEGLPPLRAPLGGPGGSGGTGAGIGAGGAGSASNAGSLLEDVSLGEGSFGASRETVDDTEETDRLQMVDRQIARQIARRIPDGERPRMERPLREHASDRVLGERVVGERIALDPEAFGGGRTVPAVAAAGAGADPGGSAASAPDIDADREPIGVGRPSLHGGELRTKTSPARSRSQSPGGSASRSPALSIASASRSHSDRQPKTGGSSRSRSASPASASGGEKVEELRKPMRELAGAGAGDPRRGLGGGVRFLTEDARLGDARTSASEEVGVGRRNAGARGAGVPAGEREEKVEAKGVDEDDEVFDQSVGSGLSESVDIGDRRGSDSDRHPGDDSQGDRRLLRASAVPAFSASGSRSNSLSAGPSKYLPDPEQDAEESMEENIEQLSDDDSIEGYQESNKSNSDDNF